MKIITIEKQSKTVGNASLGLRAVTTFALTTNKVQAHI
jgi:hypothetical protein